MLRPGALEIDVAPIVEQFITHGYARVGHVADDDLLELGRCQMGHGQRLGGEIVDDVELAKAEPGAQAGCSTLPAWRVR